jgi:formylglycine-generating enzyme required for sulfatase activity
MRAHVALLLCLPAFALPTDVCAATFGTGDNAFSIDFALIGQPGNAPDSTGRPNPVGAVGHNFRISTYEITRDAIAKANAAGGLVITQADMSGFGGNGANRPATGITWYEAARFVNWLNASEGYPPAYKFNVQPGERGYVANSVAFVWTSGEPGYDSDNPFRNARAKYYMPNIHEWYKAAYYDPHAGVYYNYPTGSDSKPTSVVSGNLPNTAVHSLPRSAGPADVDDAGGLNAFGVMAMGGNVWEWLDSGFQDLRGGGWFNLHNFGESDLVNTVRDSFTPASEAIDIGFRVAAAVPEPSGSLLIVAGLIGLAQRRRSLSAREGG